MCNPTTLSSEFSCFLQDLGAVHFASRLTAVLRAIQGDPNKKNKAVQLTIVRGLTGCKIYSRHTARYMRKFLVRLGNSRNGEGTITTIIEKYNDCEQLEAVFKQRVKDLKWQGHTTGM